mgnify:FL=1
MTEKIAKCGVFSAVAIAVSSLERLIPLQALVPLPGIKLGLSNCIILFVLLKYGFFSAFSVLLIKSSVTAVFFSGITSLVFSLSGGFLALCGMSLLIKFNKIFSLYGISVFGAALHNIGQIAAAAVMLGSKYIFEYLPVMLFISIFTGLLTGGISNMISRRLMGYRG